MRIFNASGCLDALAAPDVARQLDAFVTKTVTPLPREGNAPPRIAETAHGMLNAIGLANPGRQRFLAEHLPQLAELGVPLWVSVGGFCAADYAETCSRLAAIEAIELNLSCPNVDEAADSAAEIVAACRGVTQLPLYAKLSAAHPDVAEVARAVAAAGADGLSLINTLRATALDAHLRPVLARGSGGLSGPALKPVALHAVTVCHEATGLPIVGMGGIQTGRDALEFAACGAQDIALGTVLFADPGAPARVRAELAVARVAAGVASLATRRVWQKARKPSEKSPLEARGALVRSAGCESDQDAGACSAPFPRPADGRPQESERRPRQAREAEEGPQGGQRPDREDPRQPARVRLDGEGHRHPDGRAEVRAREGRAIPQHVPDQPVEDRRRAFRPAARRADRPLQLR